MQLQHYANHQFGGYSGAVESGNLAMQPFSTWGQIGKQIGIPEDYIKNHTTYPLEGHPQTKK